MSGFRIVFRPNVVKGTQLIMINTKVILFLVNLESKTEKFRK